jgi:16S rRNA (cytosine967-C5)-methyltransferase
MQVVLVKQQPLDSAIAAHDRMRQLEPRDRAFARLLVATALRRLGEIDARLDRHLHRPLPAKSVLVRHALRLGAVQLICLGTPPHAAVDRTVGLLRGRLMGFRGLVNAVLRKLAAETAAAAAAGTADDTGAPGRVNTPDWLWQSWVDGYGEETAVAIAAAHRNEAPLDITVKEDAAGWAERLEATVLPTGSLRRTGGGDPAALPGYAEGGWWIQDAAAALPTRLLDVRAGETVIDLCAAPGGKTAQLAAAGAIVTAVERSAARTVRLTGNLDRLGLDARIVKADAVAWRPDAPADAVLLDAPCSATGTIRRHPDIPWLKQPKDVARLADLQGRLLHAAIDMAKPGGRIVFATCSLQPEEGPAQIAALLEGKAPVALDPVRPDELPGLAEALSPDGTVRTLPCHWAAEGGLDGFYIARLRRL